MTQIAFVVVVVVVVKKFLFLSANLGTGDEEIVMEMNPQQKEFLEMSKEFSDADECSDKDVLQVNICTVKSNKNSFALNDSP